MNYQTPILSILVGSMLGASLLAQQVTLPSHARFADAHHAVSLPFGSPGFRTQLLLDAASVAPTGAVIQSLRMRADRSSLPLPATSVPNVVVSLSHSNRSVGNLDTTFANNVTTTAMVVFQGTVQLPGHTRGAAGPLPMDIVVTFSQPFVFDATQGNLLVEIVGNNASQLPPTFWLDATEAGGSATSFGQSGSIPSGDHLDLLVATGNSLNPRLLEIGRTIDYVTTLSFANPPGVVALTTVAQPFPLDLGPLGAPGNVVYVDPIVLSPLAWTQTFIGWQSTFSLAVPNLTSLIDQRVYAQSAILDPTANALGLVLSHAVETRIGDASVPLPLQQLDADDPLAAVGTVLEFGFGGSSPGAVPVELGGVFF